MKNFILFFLCCCISSFLLLGSTMQTNRGYLFSIEGTEGCGKTTLIRNLAKLLTDLNLSVTTTQEPGATQLGQNLRSMLMNKSVPICTESEFLLFAADRAQHFNDIVIPHLEQGRIVISDRMADSSLVYQGYVKGLDQGVITMINQWAMHCEQPDLVFYIKLDPITAIKRIVHRNETQGQDPFEKDILQKKELLTEGFDAILNNRPNVVVLDGTLPAEQIADTALQAIINHIEYCQS